MKRSCANVFYNGNKVVNKLKSMPEVDIVYTSPKMNYCVIYFDEKKLHNIKKQLQFIKGFKGYNLSSFIDHKIIHQINDIQEVQE